MTAWALGGVTMNPTALTITAAGDLVTKWRRFAAVTIVQPAEVVTTHLRTLTDPHLLPARCRLFHRGRVLMVSRSRILMVHRSRVLAVRRSRVLMARDHAEVQPDKDLACLSGKLLNNLDII
jgi:hypothetical protein